MIRLLTKYKHNFLSNLNLVYLCSRRKLEKKQEGDEVPKKVPHTLESLREKDETMLANAEPEEQEEVRKY